MRRHEIPDVTLQKNEGIPSTMIFNSFDQLGCGESRHPSSDWYSFSSENLLTDLQIVTEQILVQSESPSSLHLVAHSYGCSQVIKLLNSLSKHQISRIAGIILIGGALKGGPAELAKDGGHIIFKILPVFILNRLQSSLSNNFFNAAVHPNYHDELRNSSIKISNDNSMEFCKAYYRQQKYASIEEASKIKTPALVIHGANDKIFPVQAGVHLSETLQNSDFIAIDESSHQCFEEHPDVVASFILKYILDTKLS